MLLKKKKKLYYLRRRVFRKNKSNFWIVDALDGTVNYLNRIPIFASSIAYYEKKDFILGCIYNPLTKELYYSCEKNKVFKNSLKLEIKKNNFVMVYMQCHFLVKKIRVKLEIKSQNFLWFIMTILGGV